MNWQKRGRCRDMNPELFFPVGTKGPAIAQIAEAKAVCAKCPVRTECLEWAIESGQEYGIFGGMTEDERKAARRSRKRVSA